MYQRVLGHLWNEGGDEVSVRIMLIGFGSVGRGFLQLLHSGEAEISARYGFHPRVVAVVDNGGAVIDSVQIDYQAVQEAKRSGGSVACTGGKGRVGMKALDVINEVDADVVVEASSTNFKNAEPALSHITSALKRRLHVVTTNKGPLALAMPALMELAEYNDVKLRFSGTVGGGTPVLDFAKKCLVGNPIRSIRGVLNGTTNYVLNQMFHVGLSMREALAEAQKAGYAETDPSNDIEGIDTACKLVIIANWVMDRHVSLRDVQVEGISGVTQEQVKKAKEKGEIVKLVGTIGDELSVKPTRIALDHPLNVSGALNSVVFDTGLSGEVTIVGKGAGGMEAASAVLRDLIEIKRSSLL